MSSPDPSPSNPYPSNPYPSGARSQRPAPRTSLLERVRPWLATFTFSLSVALLGAAFVRAIA